jgi:translation initiation factor 1
MGKSATDMCDVCGLPLDFCVCDSLDSEAVQITVKVDKRRYRKSMTIITFEGEIKEKKLKSLVKDAKSFFASGGTLKDNQIEIQGDHKHKVKEFLKNNGFKDNNITMM